MSRDPRERFADILAAIERCQHYRERLSDRDKITAGMAYDAILRSLAVIGEAARALPNEIKLRSPRRCGPVSPGCALSWCTSTSAWIAT